MELYTSLTRLKMAMNGQQPPMTAVSEYAREIIDPDLTIGMGALIEDERMGLRCPVRGCGKYYHALSKHIEMMHADIGGAKEIQWRLSIPRGAKLISSQLRARYRARATSDERTAHMRRIQGLADRSNIARGGGAGNMKTIGWRNLRDWCPAQLSERITRLHAKLGRSPSYREMASEYGYAVVGAVLVAFGTWNNAKAQCGLEIKTRIGGPGSAIRREAVLEALAAWYAAHGDLPTVYQATCVHRAPMLPARETIQRVLGTASWPEAMRRAASILNIYGGRYGLPERASA